MIENKTTEFKREYTFWHFWALKYRILISIMSISLSPVNWTIRFYLRQCKHVHVCYFNGFFPLGKPAEMLVGRVAPKPLETPRWGRLRVLRMLKIWRGKTKTPCNADASHGVFVFPFTWRKSLFSCYFYMAHCHYSQIPLFKYEFQPLAAPRRCLRRRTARNPAITAVIAMAVHSRMDTR